MKKIIVPFKEEEHILKQLDTKEMLEVSGGFSCFLFKRFIAIEQIINDNIITSKPDIRV